MFKILRISKKSKARIGRLKTRTGAIQTPFFMPVATRGALKHISSAEIKKLGARIILANTYHLLLRPGEKLVKKAGGLSRFMGWPGAILTDSGGFQIFSLSRARNKSGRSLAAVSDTGVEFSSYLDGRKFFLSPEEVIKIQYQLGVDIAVCLDQCLALPAGRDTSAEAVCRTIKWAQQSKKFQSRLTAPKPLLFSVVQGGLDKDLRLGCLSDLKKIGFDGYNIGGLSVGESAQEMYEVLDYLVPAMPIDKPRYLMGVGYPENILAAIKRGVDMFDCVIPTREGRHGRLFLPCAQKRYLAAIDLKNSDFYTTINVNRAELAKDFSPISRFSRLPILRTASKAYLHHLLKIGEPLGQRLATLNNLEFYLRFLHIAREAIAKEII